MNPTRSVRRLRCRLVVSAGRLTDPFRAEIDRPGGPVRRILRRMSAHTRLRRERASWFRAKEDAGHVSMGRHSYGFPLVVMFPGETTRVDIGAFTSIADDVEILPGGNHPSHWVSNFPFRAMWNLPGAHADGHPASKGDVVIGNDVWIGRGARILSGVSIGDGAVVGGYSVVTRSVAPYAIVAGAPARQVGFRFPAEERQALLELRWWEKPDPWIQARVDLLNGGSVRDLLAGCDSEGPG